jgi:hypothetical protein
MANEYPVIGDPPSTGATQATPTVVLLGFVVVGAAGTSGILGRTAPRPAVEKAELPIKLVAST